MALYNSKHSPLFIQLQPTASVSHTVDMNDLFFDRLNDAMDAQRFDPSKRQPLSASSDGATSTTSAATWTKPVRVEDAVARVPLDASGSDPWMLVCPDSLSLSTTGFLDSPCTIRFTEDSEQEPEREAPSAIPSLPRKLRLSISSFVRPDHTGVPSAAIRLNCLAVDRSMMHDEGQESPPLVDLIPVQENTRPLRIQVVYSDPRAKYFADA